MKNVLLSGLLAVGALGHAVANAPAGAAPTGDVQVLCNDTYLRTFLVFKTPALVSRDGQSKTVPDPEYLEAKEPRLLEDFQSDLPAEGWIRADFNDADWECLRPPVEVHRGRGNVSFFNAAANALICLRGTFVVDDPSRVAALRLSLEYVGGVAVYVNGQELVRGNLPPGALKPDTFAEAYPEDMYSEPAIFNAEFVLTNNAAFMRRYRRLTDVAVPPKYLKKGVNVLALEIHRAPVNETSIKCRTPGLGHWNFQGMGVWAGAGLRSLSLTATPGSAVTPNIARPKGIQVWNCASYRTVTPFMYGDKGPCPVVVHVPRNGVFSGRLVVSSDQAIKGLKVSHSELRQVGGRGMLPASAVRVRMAVLATADTSWMPNHRFDGLADTIPAELPVWQGRPPPARRFTTYSADPPTWKHTTGSAMAPLWFTVRAPKDTPPGKYEGTITVAAEGLPAVTVPLHVTVVGWTLPDTKDFRVQNFAYISEDALAKRYGVALWSDKHLELLSRSMSLMAEMNSRQAIVNLCIDFYGGNKGAIDCSNEQSLVRWIKQPDGSYTHDFRAFDNYLNMVAKTIGKPNLLRINCWDEVVRKDGKLIFRYPPSQMGVTLLDPATGKLTPMDAPVPGTDEALAFWKPVLDAVRKRIEARGWWDVTAMGHNSYATGPRPEVVSVCRKIWPDGVWSYTAHNGTLNGRFAAEEKDVAMPCRFADCVWNHGAYTARGYRALLQPRPTIWCYTWRSDMVDGSDLTLLRMIGEDEILRGHDGVSDFGADLFPIKAANNRYYCLGNGRGTGGPNDSTRAMLAPGTEGAIGSERFEMLREGMELAEAVLFLQRTLDAKKVSGDLEQRINRHLDERFVSYKRGWYAFGSDAKLLTLCAEAAGETRPTW